MNQKYEFTFLLNEEDELKQIKTLITTLNGKVLTEENWGKKTLSYPIKKNSFANFYNWIIEMKTDQMKEFKKKLNFNDKLLRYLILISEL